MTPLSREIAKFLYLLKFRQEVSVVSLKDVKVVLKADQTQNKIFEDTLSLENMKRSRGAWYIEVCRDLRLDEKRYCVPTPVTQGNKFLNTCWCCMINTTHVVSSSKKMNNVNKDLVIWEPVELIASWQWRATIAPYESASSWGPRRSQRISKPVFPMTMKSMLVKKFK